MSITTIEQAKAAIAALAPTLSGDALKRGVGGHCQATIHGDDPNQSGRDKCPPRPRCRAAGVAITAGEGHP